MPINIALLILLSGLLLLLCLLFCGTQRHLARAPTCLRRPHKLSEFAFQRPFILADIARLLIELKVFGIYGFFPRRTFRAGTSLRNIDVISLSGLVKEAALAYVLLDKRYVLANDVSVLVGQRHRACAA